MADKFFQDSSQDVSQQTEEEQKIKIGERELSLEDAQRLLDAGQKAEDFAKAHGGFEKVVTEFGKRADKIGRLESQLEEIQRKSQEQTQPIQTGWTEENKQVARTQLKELLGGEPMTQTQLEQWYADRRGGERLVEECTTYEAEIDGSDGRPKFNTDVILEHMKQTGIRNPFKAYKDKYEDDLDKWKDTEIAKSKKTGMFTAQPTGGLNKQPKMEVPKTEAQLNAAISEIINQGEQV